jgi:hypothetical protein
MFFVFVQILFCFSTFVCFVLLAVTRGYQCARFADR